MGEGFPKRHRLGYQKTKTPLHEPYMGTYVSGTPVRGGDRTPYFTKRSQMASFRRRETPARAHETLFVIANTLRTFHVSWINKCTLRTKEPFRDCDIASQGGGLRFGVVNLFSPKAELDCHLNATFLERHEWHID